MGAALAEICRAAEASLRNGYVMIPASDFCAWMVTHAEEIGESIRSHPADQENLPPRKSKGHP